MKLNLEIVRGTEHEKRLALLRVFLVNFAVRSPFDPVVYNQLLPGALYQIEATFDYGGAYPLIVSVRLRPDADGRIDLYRAVWDTRAFMDPQFFLARGDTPEQIAAYEYMAALPLDEEIEEAERIRPKPAIPNPMHLQQPTVRMLLEVAKRRIADKRNR